MKRKFILLPITLTALAPMVGLVGCNIGGGNKPEPTPPTPPIPKETIDIELTYNERYGYYNSGEFNLEKDKYYNFYLVNSVESGDNMYFYIIDSYHLGITFNPEEILVVVNHKEERSYNVDYEYYWKIIFTINKGEDINIYFKCDQNINGVTAHSECE